MLPKKKIQENIYNGILRGVVVDPSCVDNYIKELNKILEDNNDHIMKLVNTTVEITKEQIKEYLKEPDVKEKLEENLSNLYHWLNKLSIFERNAIELLECYKKYIKFLQQRVLCLLTILEYINKKDVSLVSELLAELDINLDSNEDISPYDYLRIVEPLIYNIIELKEILPKANKLETYSNIYIRKEIRNINEILNFKVSEKNFGLQLLDDTLWEQYGNEICLFVPLTIKQREAKFQDSSKLLYRAYKGRNRNLLNN